MNICTVCPKDVGSLCRCLYTDGICSGLFRKRPRKCRYLFHSPRIGFLRVKIKIEAIISGKPQRKYPLPIVF